MKTTTITTSWDDGHILDMKLAELLARYDLPGTFYVAPTNHEIAESERLTKAQVTTLSKGFEIGAHTMTHPRLTKIDAKRARAEITGSKSALEDWTGKAITSFCYPGGDYTSEHKQMVKDAGFTLARTVKRFSFSAGNDPLEVPTTVHGYRHWSDIFRIARQSSADNFTANYLHWDDLAIAMFEKAPTNGGVFHLWGHSWEIEKNGDWGRLERVFKHISRNRKSSI
jgi:peptidoglycan/xylan/chitin deacetylase (PgdA/CDA1 family)